MDWEAFGRELGTLTDMGEHGSTADAQRALTHILGEQAILDGIEHYIALRPGFELFRCILMLLRPPLAMQRCYEIYRQDGDPQRQSMAVELLKWTSDGRVLDWIPAFLADANEGVQNAGIAILDQLTFCHYVEAAEAEPLLQIGENHANPDVRRMTTWIRGFLSR